MADGRIEIEFGVDSSEATSELSLLDRALDTFGQSLNEMGGDFEQVFGDLDDAAAQLASQTGSSLDEARAGLLKLQKGAKDTGAELSSGKFKKGTDDSIKGLDDLRGNVGEVSGSFGQFGGAISVVNPQLGAMVAQIGAVGGGLEGATKMTKLAGGSMRTLAVAGGALGVAAVSLGVAWKVFSGRLETANEKIKESHVAMQEGIAAAHKYKFAIQGLENAVGLLNDAEFARISAAKGAKDIVADELKGQRAKRAMIQGLKKDLEELISTEEFLEFGGGEGLDKIVLPIRDIGDALEETNTQLEEGKEVLDDNGLSMETWGKRSLHSGAALEKVREQIGVLSGSIKSWDSQIELTNKRQERTNLLLLIQSAQARDDAEEVKKLALSLAILEDVETRLSIAALRAAKALAIHSLQLSNFGPATAAAIKGIEKMFDKLEQDTPSGFKKTLSQLNTKLEETADSTKAVADETKDATEETWRGEEAADMLAQARGRQAVIERDYAKAIALANELRENSAATEEETAELFAAAWATRVSAVEDGEAAIKAAKAAALQEEFSDAQAKIAIAQEMNDQISTIISATMDRRAQAIDKDEAAALAAAEGNAEKQEKIKAKFDARRQSELSKLFKAQQATEIATTLMSGASAGIGALAPPPTGLGPVAGAPLAILVAAATAAQVALIASQQPAFHQGGIIGGQGDQAITAQGGEVVLNREAVAAMGGPSAADGLNRGGGGGGVIVIQNVYKQRVFDAVIADNLAKGGPLKSALNNATRAGRRGRVGGLL